MADWPAAMTPADIDLRDFPRTPMSRSQLFGSSLCAQATDVQWCAGSRSSPRRACRLKWRRDA